MRQTGYLLYTCVRVRYGLIFRWNYSLLFTSIISCFFPFSDLPPSSVRSGYHGVTFNQDRCHHRASSIFQPTPTGIPQRCHQKRTSKAVRICLRKHRLNCLPATDRTQVRPMLKKTNPSLHIAQLGQTSKTRQKLDWKIHEIDCSCFCLQRFDKHWKWSAHNNRKQKLCKYDETCLEKLVKSLWIYLFWAGFSLLEPKCIALEIYVKLRSVAFRNERKSGLSRHYRPPPPLDGAGDVGAHLIINFSCYYYNYYYILPLHCNFGRRGFVIFCDNFTLLFPKQNHLYWATASLYFLFL